MAREYLNPPDLAPPPQGLYNHVVKVGNQVFIAGQVSRGLDRKTIHVGDRQGPSPAGIRQSGDSYDFSGW